MPYSVPAAPKGDAEGEHNAAKDRWTGIETKGPARLAASATDHLVERGSASTKVLPDSVSTVPLMSTAAVLCSVDSCDEVGAASAGGGGTCCSSMAKGNSPNGPAGGGDEAAG